MKRKSGTKSLLGRIFAGQSKKAGSKSKASAAKAAPSGKRPTKPKSASAQPRGVVEWLRKLPLNRSFSADESLLLSYCRNKKLVFPSATGGYVLTKAGLQAAYPFVTDVFYRHDRRIWEGLCAHGVGHPIGYSPKDRTAGIHGCDGCCNV